VVPAEKVIWTGRFISQWLATHFTDASRRKASGNCFSKIPLGKPFYGRKAGRGLGRHGVWSLISEQASNTSFTGQPTCFRGLDVRIAHFGPRPPDINGDRWDDEFPGANKGRGRETAADSSHNGKAPLPCGLSFSSPGLFFCWGFGVKT